MAASFRIRSQFTPQPRQPSPQFLEGLNWKTDTLRVTRHLLQIRPGGRNVAAFPGRQLNQNQILVLPAPLGGYNPHLLPPQRVGRMQNGYFLFRLS
jgi:hypothetical protein